jgi:proton-translocating NADH-quinone oxidoreductase chain L
MFFAMYVHILLLLALPFCGSFFLGFLGRFLGPRNLVTFVILNLFVMWSLFFPLVIFVLNGFSGEVVMFDWLNVGLGYSFGFLIDSLGVGMFMIILAISTCVFLFALGYMEGDPHINRFFSYLFLFVFFMCFLALSNNLIQLFFGWEGVGLVSYLLVNFWFMRLEANRSALKAILFNKIGDMFYVVALAFSGIVFNTVDFNVLNSMYLDESRTFVLDGDYSINYFSFFIFLAAMGKSAQIGLHAWLPDAMEGPTPVSALLHSATMVTVGIFILLRLSPIMSMSGLVLWFIGLVGGVTAAISGVIGFFQFDIKKIIAYSTCSQLGFMVSAISVCNYVGCFFHLSMHAFFKALLFLTAGSVIHAFIGEQDLRKMGGLLVYMPFTAIAMLVGTLGLVGFPFLSGFYSKEFLLFFFFFSDCFYGKFLFALLFFSSIMTVLYSCKVFHLVFMVRFNGYRHNIKLFHESSFYMSISMFVLSLLTLFAGYVCSDVFIGVGNLLWYDVLGRSKFEVVENFFLVEALAPSFKIFLVIFFLACFFFYIFGVLLKKYVWSIYFRNFSIRLYHVSVGVVLYFYSFFSGLWLFNYWYIAGVNVFYSLAYRIIFLRIERGFFESLVLAIKEFIVTHSAILQGLALLGIIEVLVVVLFIFIWFCLILVWKSFFFLFILLAFLGYVESVLGYARSSKSL